MNKDETMKAFTALLAIFAIAVTLNLSGCKSSTYISGRISIILTDSPIDDANITGVYVTVTGLQYHTEQEGWKEIEGFGEPRRYNLFDLTEGNVAALGDFTLPAGHTTQIRFMLDAPEEGNTPAETPGCYITYDDDSNKTLFVPSGTQTGYKANGNFTVPANGDITITADFDVRKSVVKAGSTGSYLLKPAIRLVVNDESGTIKGTLGNLSEEANRSYIVYAYEGGSFNGSEADTPEEGSVRFPSAVSSTAINKDGSFTLAFLPAGKYDLIVASYDAGIYVTHYIKSGTDAAEVTRSETTTVDWVL